MKKYFLVVSVVLISGCAANSGVVQMGSDSYFVSKQAATGFSGQGTLKAEAISEAGQYCMGKKKAVEIVKVAEAQPPFIFGNYPKVDLEFRCVN